MAFAWALWNILSKTALIFVARPWFINGILAYRFFLISFLPSLAPTSPPFATILFPYVPVYYDFMAE